MAASPSLRAEPGPFTLVIKNQLDELVKLSVWLNQLAADWGASAESTIRLELVLAEAVTNVIEHAFADEAEHHIVVTLAYYQNQFTLELKDAGRPFDLTQYPAVELPKTLAEAGYGGLGIHLIRNYTAELRYRRENNHNILTLIMLAG